MTSTKYLFSPGDVLYSKLRPYLRKVALVDFRGLCSADMYPIEADHEVLDPTFLKFLLLSDPSQPTQTTSPGAHACRN